jgi:hypothetical protein
MSYTLYLSDKKLFVMKDDGEIFEGNDFALQYKGGSINFTEKDGLCAYSEFFCEGDWPEEYYDDREKVNEYRGIRLKMTCGGWYSIHDLIKTMNSESMSEWRQKTHTPIYEEINDPNFDEKWTEVLESLKMKAKRRHTSYKMKF